jgi:hypothetical protein
MFLYQVVEISVVNYDKSDGTNMFLYEVSRDIFFDLNKNDVLERFRSWTIRPSIFARKMTLFPGTKYVPLNRFEPFQRLK